MHLRMFTSILGLLYPVDARNVPLLMTIRNISRYCNPPSRGWGGEWPLVERLSSRSFFSTGRNSFLWILRFAEGHSLSRIGDGECFPSVIQIPLWGQDHVSEVWSRDPVGGMQAIVPHSGHCAHSTVAWRTKAFHGRV